MVMERRRLGVYFLVSAGIELMGLSIAPVFLWTK